MLLDDAALRPSDDNELRLAVVAQVARVVCSAESPPWNVGSTFL